MDWDDWVQRLPPSRGSARRPYSYRVSHLSRALMQEQRRSGRHTKCRSKTTDGARSHKRMDTVHVTRVEMWKMDGTRSLGMSALSLVPLCRATRRRVSHAD
jgi:hypothetical protein